MISNDWVRKASDEISNFACDHRSILTEEAMLIIVKHCPMKSDVAYTPVPRCDSCAHWKPEANAGFCCDGAGPDSMYLDCGENTMITFADFGCVQWKER